MTDLDIIAQIGDEIQVPFYRMTLKELNDEPDKEGIRGYVLDKNQNVTALRLCNTVFRNENLVAQLKHVHTLHIRFNGFDSFDFLTDLPELKELHIAAPYLDDFSFLSELSGLTSLDLSDNQISDISFLGTLTRLTLLYLSDNKISDISFLNNLTGLTSLDLSYNKISGISFLSNLSGLTSLDLSYNKISDISFLCNLTGLTSLKLGSNQISDISFLGTLTRLTSLDLCSNQISDISFLSNLTGLTSLDLGSNKISDISFLCNLTGLTSLDLSFNQISDVSLLSKLTELTSLYLNSNQISDISFLSTLTGLTSLFLSNNQISDISFLSTLTGLIWLYLRSNQINDISSLSNLTSLKWVYLSDNQINDISSLVKLTSLTWVYLSNNQISDLSILSKLTGLTSLNFCSNQISDLSFLNNLTGLTLLKLSSNQISDISFLSNLTGLTSLDLGSNQISDISFLSNLTGLTSLDLSSNQISDISILSNLTGLTSLDLRSNKICDISILSKFTGLTSLNLGSNKISDLSFLSKLTGLTSLNLGPNQIRDISFLIDAKNILTLDTHVWEIDSIPPNILDGGVQSIRRYLLKTAVSSAKLFEAKTLFVGEPGAGKTSLMRKLIDPNFAVPQETQASTLGIDIVPDWRFPLIDHDSNEQFKAHLWDFGGQTIQYYIHQFFLTERSLYVLLLDDRKETGNLDYWFNIIRVLGGRNCPVIVVRNEKNINASTGFDQETWRRRYGEHLTLQFLNVNLADNSDGRLAVIKNAIQKQLCSLSHVGQVLPAGWVKVREQLAGLAQENHITFQQLCEICGEHDITNEKDQQQLCGYLTDLGVIQHFPNDAELANVVFVNSPWLTRAVYQILSDKTLEEQKGCFTKKWLFNKWGDGYSLPEKNNLLLLMQKKEFDLIYPLEGADEESYIAPRLLPDVAPDAAHNWHERNLSFRYRYPFMPEGVISRLIVRLYESIANDNAGALVWANGVILEQNSCRALVKKDLDLSGVQVIDIDVQGQEYFAREFLTRIRDTLDTLHRQSFKNTARELLLPCCCVNCRKRKEPSWFDLAELKNYLVSNEYIIKCVASVPIQSVNIANILSNIVTIDRSLLLTHIDTLELIDKDINRNTPGNDEVIRFIMELTSEQRQTLFDTMREKEMQKTTVFVSYSHKDSQWREMVWPYLNSLKNMGYEIDAWVDDRKLKAGQKWKDEIQKALTSSRIGLCLVSMNFLNSDFITQHELPELLKNAESKGTKILFLHAEKSTAHLNPRISQFQHVNDPKKPLKGMSEDEQQDVLIGLAERLVDIIKPVN